ncbi:glutamate racemase [Oenococcus oeni ATCC BAA-1163]|uniref:Glutamate racemase n=1 Tax=Oenococcus oeni ATCC BAA-1163 TaxID=379360 RepID=A0NIE8_OENOE|nr:glutamate racemase [Oenococcus oeni ATCC BAA-1163]
MDNRGIGYIDSGLGGLTVVREALKQLPNESVYFVGDEARMPYGPRPTVEIQKFTLQMADFLVKKHNIKALVVACNTATAQALPQLKAYLEIPVIGVISAGALAGISATRNLHVNVIGTQSTVESKAYYDQLIALNSDLVIEQKALPEFVQLVESDIAGTSQGKQIVYQAIHNWMEEKNDGKKSDTLVLGCTHFPILKKEIQAAVDKNVAVVDPASEEILQTAEILRKNNAFHDSKNINHHEKDVFYTTGNIGRFSKFTREWLNKSHLTIKELHIDQKGLKE